MRPLCTGNVQYILIGLKSQSIGQIMLHSKPELFCCTQYSQSSLRNFDIALSTAISLTDSSRTRSRPTVISSISFAEPIF